MTMQSEDMQEDLQQLADQEDECSCHTRKSPRSRYVRAGDLTAADIGKEAFLPGQMQVIGERARWYPTWAPITMITHTKKGVTKIRRHPDKRTDHSIEFDVEVEIRDV